MHCFNFRYIFLAVFLIVPFSASANCLVCDELIEIDEERADCFLRNFDQIVAAVNVAPNQRKAVDLSACAVGDEVLSARGGIASLPTLGGSKRYIDLSGKSVYTLDKKGLFCLRDLVSEQSRPFNPSATFDLYLMCGND